jgi:uncharacterized protein YifN (PemK superfamily)
MITFVPERGQILLCDFDLANVAPEMRKRRRVTVVSPRSYNKARRCVVVPFSATAPFFETPAHVAFSPDQYRSLTIPTWAICDAIAHVSFARLDRVNVSGRFMSEMLSDADLIRIETGLCHALGIRR